MKTTNMNSFLRGVGLACALWLGLVSAHASRFALVADQSNGRVALFYVNGQSWTFMNNFVDSTTPLGALGPITRPVSVAQDQQGRIYVSDQTASAGQNRILRFDTNGAFIDMVATNGLNGFNVPGNGVDDLVCGPDGNIYGTLAFGTGNNQILKFNVAATNWSVFYSNSVTMNTPRGLDFGPDGNLYVNSRGNARMLVFNTNGALIRTNTTFSGGAQTTPMGLRWDAVGNRFICTSGNGNSVICSAVIATNGTAVVITAQNPSGGPGSSISSLGVLADGTNVFYAPFKTGSRVYLCNNTSTTSVAPVDSGTTPLLNQPTFMNYATGFGIGALQSVTLEVTRTNMLEGSFQQARLLGNYVVQSGIDITSDPATTWSSSNPGVFTVSPSGYMTAVGTGTATLSVTNGAFTASTNITVAPLSTTLIHRYSFAANANDLVGTANGTLNGGGATVADGQLVLTPTSQYDYNYADFGPGAISGYDAITFEAWASFGTNYNNCRLFDFGDTDGVSGTSYVTLIPRTSAGQTRIAIKSGGVEQVANATGTLDSKTNQHIVAVFHPTAGYMKLYLNGVLVAQNTSLTRDLAQVVNQYSYLGKSQFFVDPSANLSVDEFRVYAGVLFPTNVAFNAAAGPNNVVSDPGALLSVSLAAIASLPELSGRTAQLDVRGNFANVTNVPLTSFTGVTFSSSDTNVATVNSNGLVTALNSGTATITASYQSVSDSQTVTVTALTNVTMLVADGGGNRVQRFEAKGFVGAFVNTFAQGVYAGQPLNTPVAIAQDTNGFVYVAEGIDGGRLLKFSNTGAFDSVLGTEGVEFTGQPDVLLYGPDGNLYLSVSFGTNPSDKIYKITLPAGTFSTYLDTTGTGTGGSYTFDNPRGLAVANGVLYVADRSGFSSTGRPVHKFDFATGDYLGDFITGLTSPTSLAYDEANSRLLVAVNSIADILGVNLTNNATAYVFNDTLARTIRGIAISQSSIYFTDYTRTNLFMVTGDGSTAAAVAGGLSQNGVDPAGSGQVILASLPPAVAPTLSIQTAGSDVIVSWSGTGTLQSAPQVTGVYTDLPGATSPYTNAVSGSQQFFRLKVN